MSACERLEAARLAIAEPVHAGETIARHVAGPHFGDPVMVDVMIPTDADGDGISVLICSLSSATELAERVGRPRHRIEFPASHVYAHQYPPGVKLTLRRDPIAGQPGHALIPQLTRKTYLVDKVAYKAFANGFLARVKVVRNPAVRQDTQDSE